MKKNWETLTKIKEYIIVPKNIRNVLFLVISFLSTILSGYTIFFLDSDKIILTIVRLLLFFLTAGLVFASIRRTEIKHFLIQEIKQPAFIIFSLFIFSFLITLFFSNELSNIIGYVSFALNCLNAFLITKLFDLKKILIFFIKTLYLLSIVAIFFYLLNFVFSNEDGFILKYITTNGRVYSNFFFLSFQAINSLRIQSIFWEPGLFTSFCLLALMFDIIINDKINWRHFLVFTVSTLLSFSTFGYIVYIIIIIILLNKVIKNRTVCYTLIISIFIVLLIALLFFDKILLFLASFIPNVFDKFLTGSDGSVSLTTRIYSFAINLQIYLKSPIFGVGLGNSDVLYVNLMTQNYTGLVDAQTSTTTQLLAQFGILGILFTIIPLISVVFSKKIKGVLNKALVCIMLFIIYNKEPHSLILFDWIFIFSIFRDSFNKNECYLSSEPIYGTFFQKMFSSDDAGTLSKNILSSLIIKGLALVIGLFTLPSYINYFGGENVLGVWLTILSVLSWIMTFDLGLGNGLKNKLILAINSNDKERQKRLISSSYLATFAISLCVLIIGLIIILTTDVNAFFNISKDIISSSILKMCLIILLTGILLEFVLKIVSNILQSFQKQALSSIFPLITSLLLIIFSSVVKIENFEVQLIVMSSFYLLAVNLPYMIGSIIIFKKLIPYAKPNIKWASKTCIKSVANLGISFFLIQIGLLIINSTNEILITNIFSPTYSVDYTIYTKFFLLIHSIFNLVALPFWTMIVKCSATNNQKMIKKMIMILIWLFILTSLIMVLLSLCLQQILDIWLGTDSIQVNPVATIAILLYFIVLLFISVWSTIGNGLNVIKPQIITILFAAITKIPLSYILHSAGFVTEWYIIIFLNTFLLIPSCIFIPVYVIKKIKRRKNEISNEANN